MSNLPPPEADPDLNDEAGPRVLRAAGLYAAPRRCMTPCFGLLTFFLVADTASFVVPFYASRLSDSPWGSAERAGFLALAMASALFFGFVAAVSAERRNHTSWWFLAGHAGFPLALAFSFAGFDLAAAHGFLDPRGPAGASAYAFAAGFLGVATTLIATRRPRPALEPMNAVQDRVCRVMFSWGNIWFGIVMMFAIGAMAAAGTLIENRFGAKSAQALVYRAPWFGAVFFSGGVSMLCATFRKYPFRLEQAGWLTVHTGLAMVVIGGMTSFLSSKEGQVAIQQRETIDSFRLTTQTRLAVDAVTTRSMGGPLAEPLLRAIADFDVNPTITEPDRKYEVPTRSGASLEVVVDRYYAMGEAFSRWTDDGPREHLGLDVELVTGQGSQSYRLDAEGRRQARIPFGGMGLALELVKATPESFEALLRPSQPAGPQVIFADVGGRMSWIWVSSSGERDSGEVRAGEDLPLPMPAFKIRPAAIYRRLRTESGYEFKGYKAESSDLPQVIRVSVRSADGKTADPIWLTLGSHRTFALGDRSFAVAWGSTSQTLGFSLRLDAAHVDFYPGTREESSYESYCLLRHPAKFPDGEAIKIDMNHPLRLDGWRLFQARSSPVTVLQVNRDPGLVITYPACAVVLLGLIVVFFMKDTLRKKRRELELRRASPRRHLAWAFGSVVLVGAGPFVFGLYAATHERLGLPLSGWPSFVFGVTLLVALPIAVVWAYVRPLSRRLEAVLGPAPAPGASP